MTDQPTSQESTASIPDALAHRFRPIESVEFETIIVERQDRIVSITLNRPERKNALTEQMYGELKVAMDLAAADDQLRALILTGAGGAFCSGADVAQPGDVPIAALTKMRYHHALAQAIFELPVPTIAAVDGPAVGAGCNMALVCDFVVASERAFFAELFVHRGMGFDWGGSWLLPRLVGLRRAKEIAFFGERITAADALDFGLISKVVGEEELHARVMEMAQQLADRAPLAITMQKQELHAATMPSSTQTLQMETYGQMAIRQSEDAREGFASFIERRPPEFKGM